MSLGSQEWVHYIKKLKIDYTNIAIGVRSSNDSSSLKSDYLMDIGILGGYILLDDNTWKSIDKINRTLEVNEARGRRKSV